VRVGYDQIRRIRTGDKLRLSAHDETSVIRVVDVRNYSSFASMLESEDASRIAPDDPLGVPSLLREIYPPNKEELGVVVLEIRPIAREAS
jgi:ASC-1-like (ASCH) protein